MSNNNIQKVSIRFFNDREVRAVWDEALSKWWFSVLDVVGVLDTDGILKLAANFPNTKASRFVAWLTNSEESIDGKRKSKAYALFESSIDRQDKR